ncbi:putative signal-transduction protein with CBS domains [Desulforamulus reducens MI-1]|uniref:Putative signal-transduction protein with CBS domains n=1 Tax=Desulforamulus reducens (strain ATCC BAA-1160 / DSM 100696 / MI-1) TaxID=349161 RepID=A4J3Y7_DESRM|nr:CBS and ACT domain-containing protein [Desulforamulus reducens]ABO49790.1 putative signal-transduction protein with CBS domains [Desulforamulus reducens MI-1]
MFVKDCMTTSPVTISKGTPILDALEKMKKLKIRQLPVTDKGRLVGLVTERELLTVTPSPATTLSIFEMNYLLSKMVVGEVMVKDPITVNPETTMEEAALIMRENKIGSMLVMEEDELVGIITQTDIFDAFIEFFGLRKAATRLVLQVYDRVGAIADLTDIIRDMNISISGIVIHRRDNNLVHMVVRVNTIEPEPLVKELEARGIPVLSIS